MAGKIDLSKYATTKQPSIRTLSEIGCMICTPGLNSLETSKKLKSMY